MAVGKLPFSSKVRGTMKKRLWALAALVGVLPIGVAVAEYAGETESAAVATAEVRDVLEVAKKVAGSISNARAQLAVATDEARQKRDMVLATCLADKLDVITKLEHKVAGPLGQVEHAADAAAAQRPFVVLTVIGQKVALTVQEAAACVDSKNEEGNVTIESIEPPGPPEEPPVPFDDVGLDVPGLDVPPLVGEPADITDLNPAEDPEEPPPVASPMR